eukprot:GGOE01009902.1.p6 GENE.GGOE01009902.1~~GGOE01009902.1.p6  ORF type:complete len:108 (-),score=6.16 GGOE01009902.1:573-896(-)
MRGRFVQGIACCAPAMNASGCSQPKLSPLTHPETFVSPDRCNPLMGFPHICPKIHTAPSMKAAAPAATRRSRDPACVVAPLPALRNLPALVDRTPNPPCNICIPARR